MYKQRENRHKMLWDKIQYEMDKQELTMAEVARRSGINRSVLSEFKRGNIRKPSFELMCKISDGLGVDINYFKEV